VTRTRTPKRGDGTAWLVEDSVRHDFICFWYDGPYDAHVAELARVSTSTEALAWGRDRTTRVRIRTDAAQTYWAGTAPRPDGFTRTWPPTATG
jgi:hypothetical protein